MQSRFQKQAARRRQRNHVGECNHKRKSRDPGELRDLDERPLGPERDAEAVPTEPAEEPSAYPLMSAPRGGEEEGKPQVVCRS